MHGLRHIYDQIKFQLNLQQHGSVWWAKGCNELVSSLDSTKFLHEQFPLAFSLLESPIWMDSSTKKWCTKLEDAVGGPEVFQITKYYSKYSFLYIIFDK